MDKRLESLRELTRVACSDGTWNYNAYLHGMANGMLLALAIMEDRTDPEFLDAPGQWLEDVGEGVAADENQTL